MPFFKVTARALLIEARSPTEAAMIAYRTFEERTPFGFDVTGPDTELNHVTLGLDQQDEAITIEFGRKAIGR